MWKCEDMGLVEESRLNHLYVNNMYCNFFKKKFKTENLHKIPFQALFRLFFQLLKHVTCYEQHLAGALK
jgi:hypothetical protein